MAELAEIVAAVMVPHNISSLAGTMATAKFGFRLIGR